MYELDSIVIHCSDSPHRGDTAQKVHQWHCERGWAGIGYHEIILETGEKQNGRPWFWKGAHVRNHNNGSLGIMLMGKDYFTLKQFEKLEDRIRYYLKTNAKIKNVFGHYQLDSAKTCPNFDVPKFLLETGIAKDFCNQLSG